MAHTHAHAHGSSHGPESGGSLRPLQVAFALNLGFCLIEIFGGLYTNSLAILSDALHDLGDSLSLGLAWYFQLLARREEDKRFTYGYQRFSLLGALINASVLVIGSGFIIWEAFPRLMAPEMPRVEGMLGLALLGVLVNGLAVFQLRNSHSMNERVISLHLMEDVLGWVAVLIASILLQFYPWAWLDPALSLGIAAFILFNAVRNVRTSIEILLQVTPRHIDVAEIEARFREELDTGRLEHLHVWTLDGNLHIATLHLVVPGDMRLHQTEQIKAQARAVLQHFDIRHVTIETQIESQSSDTEPEPEPR